MKRSLRALSNFTVETKDGKKGKVKDFLFDEKQWIIRYVEVDFGNLFSSDRVLIPKVFLKQPLWENKVFPTELLMEDIERCPKLDDHLPVSRKYEDELYQHYRLNPYWATAYMGSVGNYYPPRPINVPSKVLEEANIDTILRSFKEVEGYHIHAKDGKIGHIEDLIIGDEDWQIIYAVIDTKNWLPWSKKVLIAINWMENISYVNKEVKINLKTGIIENMPDYSPNNFFDKKYELDLFDFYSSSLLK